MLDFILMAELAGISLLHNPLMRLMTGLARAAGMGFGLMQSFLPLSFMAGKAINSRLGLLMRLMALQTVNLHRSIFWPGNFCNFHSAMAG